MMIQNFPLVTIITPTHNRADYLPETIESVLSQDYPRIEYIVLDDGSLDNTTSILSTYENIIWNSHTNMGEVKTVNKGFGMAKGEIIGVVNSDDPLRPNAIRNIVEFMMQHPNIEVVYPDWDIIDPQGNLIQHKETFEYNYINMLRWHYCIPGPGTLFRKQVVDSLDGRDPQFTYVNDYDFWLRAGLITRFSRIPKTLATFRQYPNSASSRQRDQRMAEEHIRLINKIYSFLNRFILTGQVLKSALPQKHCLLYLRIRNKLCVP